MKKLEIRLYKEDNAGVYDIRTTDTGMSFDMILKLEKGRIFKYAYRDAERLAIMLNCELYLNDELIRKVYE